MNGLEKKEIANLPERYRPLSAWQYWGLSILFAVPVIGIIFLIIYSISDANINRRSFARSFFCSLIFALIIAGVITFFGSTLAISIPILSIIK